MGHAQPVYEIDTATGLLKSVRQVLSPHFDARPQGVAADLIVVHGISLPPQEFGGPWIARMFTGTLPPSAHPFFAELSRQRLSAHALIRRDGRPLQYVPFGARAWHAGQSTYQGRSACNDFSVGIEVEGASLDVRYMLVDIKVDLDFSNPRDYPYLAYFADPNEWMILVRQPHCWRFLFPLAPGATEATPAELEAVATFYDMLDTAPQPVDHHDVYVCTNISCSLRGADALFAAIAGGIITGEQGFSS